MMDRFSRHEAIDRALMIADIFEKHLCKHPVITNDADLAGRCKRIADDLGALYQAIGRSGMDDDS